MMSSKESFRPKRGKLVSSFRRLIYLIYSLLVLILAVLALVMIIPSQYALDSYIRSWYLSWAYSPILCMVLLGIIILGALIILCIALFSPGRSSRLLEHNEFGSILISKTALERCVMSTMAMYPSVHPEDVQVRIINHKRPRMQVKIEAHIFEAQQSLSSLASQLQAEIKQKLECLSGFAVESVELKILDSSVDSSIVEHEAYVLPEDTQQEDKEIEIAQVQAYQLKEAQKQPESKEV